MNKERIQAIAKQADQHALKMNPEEDSHGRPANPQKYKHDRDMKFAELLIHECAGVTLDYKNDDYYTGWCDHAAEILKRFGME